jgi:hypothetical protein
VLPRRKRLIRDFHAGQYFDLFFAAAITSVLLIRLYLHVAGYPQIGGATLHIAHMLWGGLLMLVAIALMLAYIGRGVRQLAAFIGGVGFGTFIDEVGKFVTQDNDYFYQPAVALIYITFVLIYVAVRSIHKEQIAAPEEYLVNALQEMENVAVNDLDEQERDRALSYLERSDPADPLVEALRVLVERTPLVPVPNPHPLTRLRNAAVRRYRGVAGRSWFPRAIVAFFVVQLVVKLAHLAIVLFRPELGLPLAAVFPSFQRAVEGFGFVDWAQLASAALAALFVLLGVVMIPRSRLAALRMFHRSILVSIFLTQVFVFYRDQFGALPILIFNLLVLTGLHFVLDQEAARETAAEAA